MYLSFQKIADTSFKKGYDTVLDIQTLLKSILIFRKNFFEEKIHLIEWTSFFEI